MSKHAQFISNPQRNDWDDQDFKLQAKEIQDTLEKKFLLEFHATFPDFMIYLNNLYDSDKWVYSWSAYMTLFDLCWYIRKLFWEKKVDSIQEILKFMNQKFLIWDFDINNLIWAWFLENLHVLKDILPDIIKLFPKELYEDFMKHYEHYITGDDFETIMKKASKEKWVVLFLKNLNKNRNHKKTW